MVSDVAYSIVVARTFLRDMPASCLKESRGVIPSLHVAPGSPAICATRRWRSKPGGGKDIQRFMAFAVYANVWPF